MLDKESAWADLQPKLVEAAREERAIRSGAWLDLPRFILTVEVKPFSLRHYSLLSASGNGFVTGGDITPADIVQFLWFVSAGFTPVNEKAKAEFIKAASKLPLGKTITGIWDYLSESEFDAPKAGPSVRPQKNNRPIEPYMIHRFASEYGWTVDEIMDRPLAQLWQLTQLQDMANGKSSNVAPLQDKLRADFLSGLEAGN